MTRKQIYRTIAKSYYTEPELRTNKQHDISHSGLCYAVQYNRPHITVLNKFSDDMWIHTLASDHWIALGVRPNDLIRADFCILMSLLTNKEYREISK